MQVFNLKLDVGDGVCRGGRKDVCRGAVGVRERERGEKKDVAGREDIKRQSRERDSKIVELILVFTDVKLVSLSVQKPILPFL